MNWKISKIEISSFKAFKHIYMDLGGSSLLTLDGPNGFGKTSAFDAIELLLTGGIKRIKNLFSTLMTGSKSNYDDNLFWNVRAGNKDLSIKIEFIGDGKALTLARHAAAKDFGDKSNNRADRFSHFILYEMPDFKSNNYVPENIRDDSFVEKLFGKNFIENFSYLNYLEQGQNQLLHTRLDKRKEALGNLFNTNDVKAEIDNCKVIALRLTKFIGDEKRAVELEKLNTEADSLKGMVQADLGSVEYKLLTTALLQPGWDKENPFPTYSAEVYAQFSDSIDRLQNLVPLKEAIQIREKNEKIEDDIERNKESLASLGRFGIDLGKLDAFDTIKRELNELAKANGIIKRGAIAINENEAKSLPGWGRDRLDWFLEQIKVRDTLQQRSSSSASSAAELARLKAELLAEHDKLYPDDQHCPMCGVDWKAHDAMLHKVDARTQQINEALSADGQALLILTGEMAAELAIIEANVHRREAQLSVGYNSALHNALIHDKSRLPAIAQLGARLQAMGTQINYSFSENREVVDARTQELTASMRGQKTLEKEPLPDDWRKIITAAFKEIQDFYIIELKDLKDKGQYVALKANEAKSSRLKQCLEEQQRMQRENDAARRAKEKVSKLKTTLEKTERNYADQTISEIELIFHIYSGRLIQNYQRGLGLFIESKDGKQLRFLTAEKSEHDAVLSMSSGQVSALSLAFFLSLNKVYSRVPLILIDDPSQSLDEVNVASLTDLLRCELNNRQLIVSSHEDDISAYMRYRFTKAGLSTRSLNMQLLTKEGV
ncbi:AAA family ATPase [Pectobacterium sp. IFB5596]|uniref:AAA family ATPase n=1 Tax=Pectobacterium sp. IFB5596 TaxID=1839803 RepID=UPI001F1EBC56|nr:AAA family ATPase [Pectobacterium sp. IFB5596]MCE9732323.1 recombinase RecF [Pectobacterium sp. IFB5596]